MFWRHEIHVPSGFEAVVDGRLEARRPLRVGAYDAVHFVSFAPFFEEVSADVVSQEGIAHTISVMVKIECRRDNLAEMLRDWGYSTYRTIVRVSAEEVARRQSLMDSIEAAIRTYGQSRGLFELEQLEQVRQELHQKISGECVRARLAGEVVACAVARAFPEADLLAHLAARAGLQETADGDARVRRYADAGLGAVVEFHLEMIRQREMIQAEAARARVDAQKQMAIVRAEVKIVEIDQENRLAARQAELQSEEARRQQAAQERNADIKESGAAYEFAYKSRRLDEERSLADRELEIARLRDLEEATLRERRRMDAQLELERERELARIRAEEKAATLQLIGNLIEKLAQVPATSYNGVRTLVTGAGGAEAREFAAGLVFGLLGKAADLRSGDGDEEADHR
jgi:hypothetical protein